MTIVGRARRRLFGVPSPRAVFESDGFSPLAWPRFRDVAETLVEGYHAALTDPRPTPLQRQLATVPTQLSGIAYEGAGMGLAALDLVTPGTHHVSTFSEGPARNHLYPFYVGVGLAYARLRRLPEAHLETLDPVLGWVTADGYGFHEAFFRRGPHPALAPRPQNMTDYGRQMFDQGVGRALWFSLGAEAEVVHFQVRGFAEHRHRALWGGIGLAASYCGGSAEQLRQLHAKSGDFRTELAVGAAIAAWGRDVADSPAPHTELAGEIFAGQSAATLARIAEDARIAVPRFSSRPAMEKWRCGIADRIAGEARVATQELQQQLPHQDTHNRAI